MSRSHDGKKRRVECDAHTSNPSNDNRVVNNFSSDAHFRVQHEVKYLHGCDRGGGDGGGGSGGGDDGRSGERDGLKRSNNSWRVVKVTSFRWFVIPARALCGEPLKLAHHSRAARFSTVRGCNDLRDWFTLFSPLFIKGDEVTHGWEDESEPTTAQSSNQRDDQPEMRDLNGDQSRDDAHADAQ